MKNYNKIAIDSWSISEYIFKHVFKIFTLYSHIKDSRKVLKTSFSLFLIKNNDCRLLEWLFFGHLSYSGYLLPRVDVHQRTSSIVSHRASFVNMLFSRTRGLIFTKLVCTCSNCMVRKQEKVNFMTQRGDILGVESEKFIYFRLWLVKLSM